MQSSIGTRNVRAQDSMLMGLVLWTLVHTSEALGGEPVPAMTAAPRPQFLVSLPASALADSWLLPPRYQTADVPEPKSFPVQDFRPRGRSLLERDPVQNPRDEAPMIRGTTVWQRLRDYRSRDRVRVVTLWETGGSSVSLQAGKRGNPSLQWTSRAMNRGGATRGLFDEFLTTSLRGVGRGLHWGSHSAPSEPPLKPLRSMEAGSSVGPTPK